MFLTVLFALCSLGRLSVNALECHPSFTATTTGVVLPSGALQALSHVFDKGQFEETEKKNEFRVCICKVSQCLNKCCKADESLVNKTCTKYEDVRFQPDVYNTHFELLPNISLTDYFMVYGTMCQHGKYILKPDKYPTDHFWVLSDGSLAVGSGLSDLTVLKPSKFCLDVTDDSPKVRAFVCFDEEDVLEDGVSFVAYPVGMLISIPFLLLTFLVYALLPELRSLHGKSLMCHVASLLTAYVFLSIIQLGGSSINYEVCVTSAFIVQFSFLATFFWLNVMSFDIWWAFSSFAGFRGSVREREFKRFLLYSCYAWGGPLIMLGVSLFMDFSPHTKHLLRPNFGFSKCFFHSRDATLAYFYGPMGLIVICNIVLFVLTAIKIFIVKKETKVLSNNESRRNDEANKQRFVLYLKLFLVMGVNWALELISWSAPDAPKWVWYVTDIANTLQGIFIFLIFVCKARIKKLVMLRLCPHLVPRDPDTNTSSLKMSMSRNSTALHMSEMRKTSTDKM